ncbi:MAG TPA: hypothetical protein VHP38_13920, partial [Ruminiclostridium sp.]|nr:hypothetical protein [Ruminiclostridium sp.]
TSNLDSITEKAIEHTINEATKGITAIIIAHRLSTIMRCDRIYVMDKGGFVESGTHNELMSKGGIYYSLWKEQIPGFDAQAAAEVAAVSMGADTVFETIGTGTAGITYPANAIVPVSDKAGLGGL